MDLTTFTLRLLVAFLAGSAIGFERQWHHKTAGLRTNALVAMGAAIYTLISIEMIPVGGDVTHIIGQVVTGIGFLGAGVILHQGIDVRGLTTAATIWCSAALGCMAAGGYFSETAICTAFVLFINAVFWRVDDWIKK